MHVFTRSLVPPSAEQKWLAAQLDISQLLLESALSGPALYRAILEALPRHLGIPRTTLVLVGPPGASLRLVLPEKGASGASGEEPFAETVESIRNRVLQTGKPMVIEQLSREPLPGGGNARTAATDERSCVCVPLMLGKQCLGVLAVELDYDKSRELELFVRNLRLVASLLMQSFRAQPGVALAAPPGAATSPAGQDFTRIVGASPQMRQLLTQASQVARSAAPVLLRGESGTGKALLAQTIHENSSRAAMPFVRIRCMDVEPAALERELFGEEAPGAAARVEVRRGRLELAEGGTLFLDEVTALAASTQLRLLRLLQEQVFERVGGSTPIPCNVRVLCATRQDPERALLEKTFREDLYYRLNVFTLFVPALRERKTDIGPLAGHFLSRSARANGKRVSALSDEVLDLLMAQRWPGNVRELEAVIERSVLASEGELLLARHLPSSLQAKGAAASPERSSLADAVEQFERNLLAEALKTTHGNCARAARMLDTTERIFHYKIRKYGLDPRQFKG